MAFALGAFRTSVTKQLKEIRDLVTGFSPAQIEQLKRITNKVEAIDKKETE